MTPDVRTMVLNLPTIRAIRERRTFEAVARYVMPVAREDTEARYWKAHEWCSSECVGKWRLEPAQPFGTIAFSFETLRDAVLFRLRFDDLTP